jgi:hypothetical protein
MGESKRGMRILREENAPRAGGLVLNVCLHRSKRCSKRWGFRSFGGSFEMRPLLTPRYQNTPIVALLNHFSAYQVLGWILSQSNAEERLMTLGLVKMGHRIRLRAASLPSTELIQLESGDDVQALLKKLDLGMFWPTFDDQAIDTFAVSPADPFDPHASDQRAHTFLYST